MRFAISNIVIPGPRSGTRNPGPVVRQSWLADRSGTPGFRVVRGAKPRNDGKWGMVTFVGGLP
ncbi:hypothetical protein GCM10009116_09510 [Brevundimonas basaltis]